MRKRILVLFGGCSTEYEVSLQSAYGILTHMDEAVYEPLLVGITRDGAWRYCTGSLEGIPADCWQADSISCTLRVDRGQGALLLPDGTALSFDAAFPILHGKNGEDGTVQGVFELMNIPLIGCGSLSSALCMDKGRAHQLVNLTGVRTPKGIVFRQGVLFSEVAREAEHIGYPLFVKPVRAGSSFGVSRVEDFGQLEYAVREAFSHDREILLEEAIPGFEVGCAVLGNQDLTVGLVDEIELSGGFFNFQEKYTLKTSAIHCPARIPESKVKEIQEIVKTIYRALDCRGFARVDLFLTPDGEIVFNEVNTIPGFTSHSRYPNMMRGIGLDFGTLVSRILELGVEG